MEDCPRNADLFGLLVAFLPCAIVGAIQMVRAYQAHKKQQEIQRMKKKSMRRPSYMEATKSLTNLQTHKLSDKERILTPAEIAHCRAAFLKIDTDGSGMLDEAEMLEAIRSSGHSDATAVEVANLFAAIDDDGNGKIDIDEFLKAMARMHAPIDEEAKEEPSNVAVVIEIEY
jgi:hypothetical protein